MSKFDEFINILESTEIMRQLRINLQEEMVRLLGVICRDYQNTGKATPDHCLHLAGYVAETALKSLLSAGMIKQQSGGRLAIYSYEPTKKGLEQYQRLKAKGCY